MTIKDYSDSLQRLFLEMMIENVEAYSRVQNIYNVENFDRSLRDVATFVRDHVHNFKAMPTIQQVNAACSVDFKGVVGVEEAHYEWFMSEFEGFSKRKELERAILKSADLIEQGDFAPVEKLIKDAVQIGLVKNLGTDYFADPRARLMQIKTGNGQVSTGWTALDRALYGGMNRGELSLFLGQSGAGKSLFLQNMSVNWVAAGLNGVYLTLELSEDLTSMRIDSMNTSVSTKEIFKRLDDVELKIGMLQKKAGKLQIKYMASQSTCNDIRSFIKEYQIQTGITVDFLMVDYIDLLMPASVKVDPSNLFIKDKYVSEELRNLAKEFGILVVSAVQMNRSAVDEVEFNHSHISGGISKINTSDNVFSIYTSRNFREVGKYQLQLLKTRSSSGVGMKIDLAFNVDTLRITDCDEEPAGPTSSDVINQIKTKAKVVSAHPKEAIDPDTGEITKVPQATTQAKSVKDMLNALKSQK